MIKLTNQQVADILNVTVNTVNSEYNDYIEKQNPFNMEASLAYLCATRRNNGVKMEAWIWKRFIKNTK